MASNYDLADRVLGGGLAERLTKEVGEGTSFDDIAGGLTGEGIDVSRETVRRWCIQLGLDTSRGRVA